MWQLLIFCRSVHCNLVFISYVGLNSFPLGPGASKGHTSANAPGGGRALFGVPWGVPPVLLGVGGSTRALWLALPVAPLPELLPLAMGPWLPGTWPLAPWPFAALPLAMLPLAPLPSAPWPLAPLPLALSPLAADWPFPMLLAAAAAFPFDSAGNSGKRTLREGRKREEAAGIAKVGENARGTEGPEGVPWRARLKGA